MRSKLQKFTEFAQALLPHETAYLLSMQQFDNKVKLAILKQVDHNCRRRDDFQAFDEDLDKRKYSNLKLWITERLHAADVDTEYAWLLDAERAIETDSITPATEERLLINYYGNRLLLHSRFQEYDEAEYYGYLLVRVKTTDYIHYVNNLSAVLLRQKKYAVALADLLNQIPCLPCQHSYLPNTPTMVPDTGVICKKSVMLMKLTVYLLFLLLPGSILVAQDCPSASAAYDLHANAVSARILNRGALFTDGQTGYFLPNPQPNVQNPTTMFTAGLWIGGVDPAFNLKLSAVTYGTGGFYAGPLDPATGEPYPQACFDWDRIFHVRGAQIAAFLSQLPALAADPDAAIAQFPEIMGWPGRNNPHFETVNGFAQPANLSQPLAPFFDQDGDAMYNPLAGDYPVLILNGSLIVPAELTWCVYHSVGPGNPPPALNIPLEIHQTAWAFDCVQPAVLANTIFTSHKIIYRGTEPMDSVQVAVWVDSQIGNCGLLDDYLGSLPDLHAFYSTSNRTDDNCMSDIPAFSGIPPVQSVTFLDRPMDRFITFSNGSIGTPIPATTDPKTPVEFFRYLTGHWRDGQPLTFGGDGYNPGGTPAMHAFPDDPANPSGWSFCTANLPAADRRGLGVSDLGRWDPGEINQLVTAWAVHGGAGVACDLGDTQADIAALRDLYDNAFSGVCSPLTALPIRNREAHGVTVFPNPASQNLYVRFERQQPLQVRLFDVNGRLISRQTETTSNPLSIPVHQLAKGLYTLECLFEQGAVRQKVLIQPGK